jgi:putative DNA primase/helicase
MGTNPRLNTTGGQDITVGPPPHLPKRVFAPESCVEDTASTSVAAEFVRRNAKRIRYVPEWRRWLVWDGRRWKPDPDGSLVQELVQQFAEGMLRNTPIGRDHARMVKFLLSLNTWSAVQGIQKLASADSRIRAHQEQLNQSPYLLNVANGCIELGNGCKFREHRQSDLLTQIAAVKFDANADCPLWQETVKLVFDGDADLIRYVQTLLGYSLAGTTDEHILPICFGDGQNGKSTVWNAVCDLLGDYATLASQDLLLPTKHQHPTEIADMYGKRFVAVAEPEQGRKLAESRVKEMTGDRILKARRMREDFWEFTPTHTFWLSTNHKPRITGTDLGIWRRVKLIPFLVKLSDVTAVDTRFPEKLAAEYPGILNWLLEGWKDYRQNGLIEPPAVAEATAEYRSSEDELGEFIRETYIENPSFMVAASDAFSAYQEWGGKMTKTAFGLEMGKRYDKEKHTSGKYRMKWVYNGIGLLE